MSSKLRAIFFPDRGFRTVAPKFGNRPIVVIEQGGTAEGGFDAVDGTIDSVTTTVVFSYCKPNPYRKIAKG